MNISHRALVVVAVLAGCGGPSQPEGSLEPTIVVTSGPIPPDTVNASLAAAVRLEARDAGRPVRNVVLDVRSVPTGDFDPRRTPHVSFGLPGDRLRTPTLQLATREDGSVAFLISRGVAAGTGVVRITGQFGGESVALELPWVIRPGAPARLELAPADTAIYLGATFQYRVDLRDDFSNPVSGPVSLDLSSAALTATPDGRVAAVSHGRVRVRGHAGAAEAIRWVSVVPRFALAALSDGIILTESDGHDQRRIAGSASANPLDSWPGEPRLVVGKFNELLVVPIAGQPIGSIAVPGIGPGQFLWPRFDRDGRWIYVALRVNEANGSELWRVRSDGTFTERLTTLAHPGQSDVNPHPSPDGARVVFSTDRRDPTSVNFSEIAFLDLATGGVTITGERGFLPRWSPDGTRVGFLGFMGEIKIMNVATGAVVVTTIEPYFEGGLDWSPDGEWLLGASIAGTTFIRAATGETLPVRSLSTICCAVFRR